MSATLPNLDILAKWLDATLFHTDFRPVPLKEYLKIGKNVYNAKNLSLSHTIKPSVEIKVMNNKQLYCLICILLLYRTSFFKVLYSYVYCKLWQSQNLEVGPGLAASIGSHYFLYS